MIPLLEDQETLQFLRHQAKRARYVTAVCTGSLLLGAAGLLDGYEATTHWAYHELLAACGAKPVKKRVVVDRNRITGGGVTAGVDFAPLRLAVELCGEDTARAIQLGLEYDPEPPFRAGTPALAGAELTARVRARFEPSHANNMRQSQTGDSKVVAGLRDTRSTSRVMYTACSGSALKPHAR